MKENYRIVHFYQCKEQWDEIAEWFSSHWGIPKSAYLVNMKENPDGSKPYPQWYVVMEENRIIAGMGVIENDFHNRKDLYPNVCAVYTEKDVRGQGIAKELLEYVTKDMAKRGFSTLYLVTDHHALYERFGWTYHCDVLCDGETHLSRMYVHHL